VSRIKEYELFSDEVKADPYLIIGGVFCTNTRRTKHLQPRLTKVRSDFGYNHEMHWKKLSGKVPNRYLDVCKAWVDVFLDDPHSRFSILVVDRTNPAWRNWRPKADRKPTEDDRLACVFYQFLRGTFDPLSDTKRWWVYPDWHFFNKRGVLNRVEFLFNRTYKKAFGQKTSRQIRLARELNSKHEDMIQLTDVLLGAMRYVVLDDVPDSPARRFLIDHCRKLENMKTQRGKDKLKVATFEVPDSHD
jgi:hypothetical protein